MQTAEDGMTQLSELAGRISDLLRERGETVAVSESSTGGLVSAALLAVPGASAYFMGGVVVYTGTARDAFLGIDLDDHPGMRSASEPYAALCAKTVRERLGTVWGIAETGAAGPTGNRYGDAAGHTCIAVSGPVERAETLETKLTDREANMRLFAERLLEVFEGVLRGRAK
jgi:PncC family amidohydrolase